MANVVHKDVCENDRVECYGVDSSISTKDLAERPVPEICQRESGLIMILAQLSVGIANHSLIVFDFIEFRHQISMSK